MLRWRSDSTLRVYPFGAPTAEPDRPKRCPEILPGGIISAEEAKLAAQDEQEAPAGRTGEGLDYVGESAETETFRHAYSRDQSMLIRRLRRIEGQVRGIERMIERREYCIDILQQTAALRAAVDSVALLILEDHVQGCVRTAAENGDADRYIEEVLDVVRRTLGKPVRTPRV
jgi:DNA-binding FrmR family transcriptional regulator